MGPETGWQVRCKYAFDRLAAALAAVLLSPLLALVALAIVVDDGRPVFFRQSRPGCGRRPFRIWKFRTMVVDADELLDGKVPRPGARRITRVGALLRRTSLDELPQLWNILGGSMSFVGPRPVVPEHLRRYTPEQMRRFRMRPGVTGLAQVRGRNTLPWSKRIEYDNWYIDNYSLLLDARILWETLRVVATGRGLVLDRNPGEVDDLGPVRSDGSEPRG